MTEAIPSTLPHNPKLVHNITHFCRALRNAGLPLGSGQIIQAIRAVEVSGFTRKDDFFWALHACLVYSPQQHTIFSQIFHLYWRDPRYLERMMSLMLPSIRGVQEDQKADAGTRRAAEALLAGSEQHNPAREPDQTPNAIEVDAKMTMSAAERLRTLDFEQMTVAELNAAKRAVKNLDLPVTMIPSRRNEPVASGQKLDWRRTFRNTMRQGGEICHLAKRRLRPQWPNLVVICDISGSMSQYSRVVLHFMHAVVNTRKAGWSRVYAFTFGTRLTNITRQLTHRDVDEALTAAGNEAKDWDGGTRIGRCLRSFNRDWARRVLGRSAVVLLISDGLERDDPELLEAEMERLHLSSKHLIWLNPLLRWDGFAPKARGARAMLSHVDSIRSGHSIESIEDLAKNLSAFDDVGEKRRLVGAL